MQATSFTVGVDQAGTKENVQGLLGPVFMYLTETAVVYAVGVITSGSSSVSMFGEQTLGSSTIINALRKANKDKTVRAIVLRVDSPGGSALASDLIWREIERIKKPVIASMGNTAASGGGSGFSTKPNWRQRWNIPISAGSTMRSSAIHPRRAGRSISG